MLTDTALKNLRPKARAYKSTDRDGMYVYVSTGGAISFRYDYRFNGRRETMTLGRYGRAGLTLAQARERLIEVKKAIADGVSPAVEKQRAKRRLKEAHDFAQVAQGWMDRAPMADSTRDMRRAIFNRDILPKWKNRLLSEITPDDLRAHCKAIVDRGAPATAIHVRDIVKQIYGWAILHGEKIDNPADDVGPASIATFRPRDRSLTPAEIRIMLMLLGEVATLPTIRLGLKFRVTTLDPRPPKRPAMGICPGRSLAADPGLQNGVPASLRPLMRTSVASLPRPRRLTPLAYVEFVPERSPPFPRAASFAVPPECGKLASSWATVARPFRSISSRVTVTTGEGRRRPRMRLPVTTTSSISTASSVASALASGS